MADTLPTRTRALPSLGACLCASGALAMLLLSAPLHAQFRGQSMHAQLHAQNRQPMGPHGAPGGPPRSGGMPMQERPSSPHIGQWMQNHQNLTPQQQQHALSQEPGFRSLPPEQQQRMQQRLSQLNSMPPDRRQRTIDRVEAMERLSPAQRQQVRGAMADLASLPPGRRANVAHAFNQLRALPPDQRQQRLNNPAFRSQFSDQERGTLSNLMAVEPMLPPPIAATRKAAE